MSGTARTIIYACLLAPRLLWAIDVSEVGRPPDTETVYIGNVIQNGVPMQMEQIRSSLAPEELLAFYKQKWADNTTTMRKTPVFLEKEAGPWKILSKLDGKYNIVVQIKDNQGHGSEGYISVSDLTQPPEISRIQKEFPRLGGTKLVSSTQARDEGKIATTLILRNEYSVDSNDAFYRSELTANGWRLIHGELRDGSAVMLFDKRNQQCELAVSREGYGDSVIFANITESSK